MTPNTLKHAIGTRIRLIPIRNRYYSHERLQYYVGAIGTVTGFEFNPFWKRWYYTTDIPMPDKPGKTIKTNDTGCVKVDDKPAQGDWNKITKLLGVDIRQPQR